MPRGRSTHKVMAIATTPDERNAPVNVTCRSGVFPSARGRFARRSGAARTPLRRRSDAAPTPLGRLVRRSRMSLARRSGAARAARLARAAREPLGRRLGHVRAPPGRPKAREEHVQTGRRYSSEPVTRLPFARCPAPRAKTRYTHTRTHLVTCSRSAEIRIDLHGGTHPGGHPAHMPGRNAGRESRHRPIRGVPLMSGMTPRRPYLG